LKALALELGVHGQHCAQFDQDKIRDALIIGR